MKANMLTLYAYLLTKQYGMSEYQKFSNVKFM